MKTHIKSINIKKKRKLSKLQLAYKGFLLGLLCKYGVDSPAKLNYEQKKKNFNTIKEKWQIKKAIIFDRELKKPVPLKKTQYTKVKISRPSIPLKPKANYKSKHVND